jgi:hypothetical protein
MRKILSFIFVFLIGLSVKAQQITFTSINPVYSNDASVLITAQGEDNNLAVDMGTLPSLGGALPTGSPSNGLSSVYLTNITRVSYYSPTAKTKSSFTARVYSSVNFDVTATWELKVNFVNLNGPSISTGTVKYTATVKPGTRPPSIFYNTEQFKFFTKKGCTDVGTIGSSVKYTVPARKYSAATLQEAETKAYNDINVNGQNYANTNGTCVAGYYNEPQSQTYTTFTRPNSDEYAVWIAAPVTYSVAAGKYSALTLNAANALALNDISINGQDFANTQSANTGHWEYFYYNKEYSQVFTKNDCASGSTGNAVTYTVPAKKYNSGLLKEPLARPQGSYYWPQVSADVEANGQNYANANGTCTLNQVVYAKLGVTGVQSGIVSVSVYLYNDAAATQPVSVNGLPVSFSGGTGGTVLANGSSTVLQATVSYPPYTGHRGGPPLPSASALGYSLVTSPRYIIIN